MTRLKLLLVLFFTTWPLLKVECETIHMIPPGGSCQGAPTGPDVRCLTLQQYFNNPSSSSNIFIELQPGNHSLEIGSGYGLEVSNVENFTMVSNGGILDCSEHGQGNRVFFDGHHHIYIRDSCYVYIGPMTAIDCQSYLLRVNEVVIEGGSFNAISGRTRPAISLSNVTNAMIREWSCSNYSHGFGGGCLNLSSSMLQILDSVFTDNRAATGGVVSVGGTTSSLTVERCSFRNNSGHDGGVFYTEAFALLAIANSNFSDNSATSRGGVVCHESGSGRFTVNGSDFTNNIAKCGGAVYFSMGGPFTFVEDSFISNSATLEGGAVYLSHCGSRSSTTVANTLFTNNVAQTQRGGAVYHEYCGSLIVTDSHFLNNSAPGTENDASGGAIYSLESDGAELMQSTFTNNMANMEGGGVSIRGNYVYLVISQSTFFSNRAMGGGGGAIHYGVHFGNVSIMESDFSYNTALYCAIIDVDGFFQDSINFTSSSFTYNRAIAEMPEGDITCIRNATVFIINSTLSHNSAAQHAGVFSIDGGIVTIVGSSFINNTAAGDGGVMYTYYYPTIYSIYGSTFSQNTAGDDGGVLFVGRADSEVRVHNSIFTDNNAVDQGGIIAIVASSVMINRTNLRGNSAASGGSISACNSQVSVENVRDLQVRVDPLNLVCTYYSGDSDRYDISILWNYGMIESITPPASWQYDSFYIEPTQDSDCPVELTGIPCFTLEDYYYNPSVASNIYMELQPGNHSLDSGFRIEIFNTRNFTMVSNGSILDCNDTHNIILITDVGYVYIRTMTVINCQFFLERVNELVVEDGSFYGINTRHSLTALFMSTRTVATVRQLFCSNYNLCLNVPWRGSLVVSDSTFINNHGRVLQMGTNSYLTVNRCSFRNNRGIENGGVIYSPGADVVRVFDSTFINNHGHSVVWIGSNSILMVVRCSFRNNRGIENGGVIFIHHTILSILCSTFCFNVANQHGGVIYSTASGHKTVSIEGSSFYNNTAIMNGGVIYMNHPPLNIVGSNFSKNSAGGDGGVLYLSGTQATVHNSTFTNNNVPNTGGVSYVTGSTLNISETNFLNNTAANGGSVIRACDGSQVTVTSDLQTGTDPTSSSCTLYNGDIDHYNTTYNYCPTVGPQTLAVCSLSTYVPSTTSPSIESHTTISLQTEPHSTTSPSVETHSTTDTTSTTENITSTTEIIASTTENITTSRINGGKYSYLHGIYK